MFVNKKFPTLTRIKISFLICLFWLVSLQGFSQHDSSIKITGYVDAYYAYSNDSVGVNNYQKFPVISPRSDAFGINIAQLTAQYSNDKVRAVATFHYGDIPASAWSPTFNLIQ